MNFSDDIFQEAVRKNHKETVASMLTDPSFVWGLNVKTMSIALSDAARLDYVDILKMLMARNTPYQLDLNMLISNSALLKSALEYGSFGVVRFLLTDPRVDVAQPDRQGRTPVWAALHDGYLEVVRWMIASGKELGDVKRDGGAFYYTLTEPVTSRTEVQQCKVLLKKFAQNPMKVRHDVRILLGTADEQATHLFALVIFVSDDYLSPLAHLPPNSPLRRFFRIVSLLPLELQMTVCNRLYASGKDLVPKRDSEAGFKWLARIYTWT